MNKFIGLALIGFFIYFCSQFFSDGFTPTNQYYAQLIISGLGGVGVLFSEFSYLIKMPALPSFNCKKEKSVLPPSSLEQEDFRCLIHLRNRMLETKNKKGLELINEINSVIFDINQENNVKQ